MKTIAASFTLFSTFALVLAIGLSSFSHAQAGHCFAQIDPQSRCKGLIRSGTSREECCSQAGAAYSDHQLPPGMIYFVEAFGKDIPCTPCNKQVLDKSKNKNQNRKKNKCRSCPPGKSCSNSRASSGRRAGEKCDDSISSECNFNCTGDKMNTGSVCGTDGRTYRNMCRLEKKICRTRSRVQLAYNGSCRNQTSHNPSTTSTSTSGDLSTYVVNSCNECQAPKTCLMDQFKKAFCLPCKIKSCPDIRGSPVCGSDGISYQSKCHLHQTACSKGGSIQIAHSGLCSNVNGTSGQ